MSDLLPFAARVIAAAVAAGLIGLAVGWAYTTRTGGA